VLVVVTDDRNLSENSRAEPATAVCSAKGCHENARWALRWNNPKLHPPERRKIWLACEEHRASLGEFLNVRGMLREVEPFKPPAGSTDTGERHA
jgi:hypothetical protein